MNPVQPLATWLLAVGAAVVAAAPVSAGAEEAAGVAEPDATLAWDLSGQLRAGWAERVAAGQGPLARANTLLPGLAPTEPSAAALQAELKAQARTGPLVWQGTVTLQHRRPEGQSTRSDAWVNEAVVSAGAAGWQWSAGKKVVSWDVGYAFRPNDGVQQEVRRTLMPATLVGRPLVMAEHFDASTAWSVVAVNPTKARASTGADEPALAARVYHRAGEVDWHGFARQGSRTGASVGAAVSWVADEALELHASVRHYRRHDTLSAGPGSGGGSALAANPWQPVEGGRGQQALVGGTWTGEQQLSLLAEAWYDGTALSPAQWRGWANRNQALATAAQRPGGPVAVPLGAVAGNLAWQGSAFQVSPSLHRSNLYARLSWTHGAWQPALDVLYHPADGGRLFTVSLVWQGDRVKWEGGARWPGGRAASVARQLPVGRQAYLQATWSF